MCPVGLIAAEAQRGNVLVMLNGYTRSANSRFVTQGQKRAQRLPGEAEQDNLSRQDMGGTSAELLSITASLA